MSNGSGHSTLEKGSTAPGTTNENGSSGQDSNGSKLGSTKEQSQDDKASPQNSSSSVTISETSSSLQLNTALASSTTSSLPPSSETLSSVQSSAGSENLNLSASSSPRNPATTVRSKSPIPTSISSARLAQQAKQQAKQQAEQKSQAYSSSSSSSSSANNPASASKLSTNEIFTKATIEEERVWVQCNTCDKWRSLPSHVDPNTLPDIWTCGLNSYDPSRMNCSAPEESYKQMEEEYHVQLKAFLKGWTKRLRNADRAEIRLPPSAVTRGRKRKLDSEWIQCCNPSCRKWRAVSRGVEIPAMLKRLNRRQEHLSRGGGEGTNWYCSMNSWDDTKASCGSPQEPLWNCKWNL